MLKSRIYDRTSIYKHLAYMEYKLSNVYETLHSLYTKRCCLAVYETPVYEMLVTQKPHPIA